MKPDMKTVILAGGRGRRMGEAGLSLPKPVTLIGDRPVIWHIMHYLAGWSDDFLLALGHHRDQVCEQLVHQADRQEPCNYDCLAKLEFSGEDMQWRVSLFDTGEATQTAGRIKRLADHLHGTFILSWSDGLTNADLTPMIEFHRQHQCLVTMLAVRPPVRFGKLKIGEQNRITAFSEKQADEKDWVNGGLCIVEPEVFSLIHGDSSSWEHEVLPQLTELDQLMAWRHDGFWQCMDYPHEAAELDVMWKQGRAPWKKRDQ